MPITPASGSLGASTVSMTTRTAVPFGRATGCLGSNTPSWYTASSWIVMSITLPADRFVYTPLYCIAAQSVRRRCKRQSVFTSHGLRRTDIRPWKPASNGKPVEAESRCHPRILGGDLFHGSIGRFRKDRRLKSSGDDETRPFYHLGGRERNSQLHPPSPRAGKSLGPIAIPARPKIVVEMRSPLVLG